MNKHYIFVGRNRVTQPYGSNHGGVDIVGDDNATICAVYPGHVVTAHRWDGRTKTGTESYGNFVIIEDTAGRRHFYAHLESMCVSVGDNVGYGDKLGIMGSTGNSTGPHVHYEVRDGMGTDTRINPRQFCGVDNRNGTYKADITTATVVISKPLSSGQAQIKVGSKVRLKKAAKDYANKKLAPWVYGATFDVLSIKGDRAVIGIKGEITAAVHRCDLVLI